MGVPASSTKVAEQDVVIVGAARTPFGSFGGSLRDYSLPDLGSLAVREALQRSGSTPADVDELALGVNLPGSDRSIARQTALRAGIPSDRNAYTVDRACCSSLTAITMLRRAIRSGEVSLGVAGGAENMSRIPYFLEDMRWGHRLGHITLSDQLVISCPHTGVPRAVQAADEAVEFNVSREEQDAWAVRSQTRCAAAQADGKFAQEIVAVDVAGHRDGPRKKLERDESPRPETTLEKLSSLPTVYGSSTVTPGNAPGMATGASALVLTTRAHARAVGADVLATILNTAMASGAPERIASIPAVAASRVLTTSGHALKDVALIEINEAFAAVPLVTTLVLADRDPAVAERLRDKVNVNGGAIALGHPTGATAARLVMTLTFELRRRGGGLGLVTLCGGVGEGEALLLRVDA